jgi:formylglycine-generating enzyme required for sulfatase activity
MKKLFVVAFFLVTAFGFSQQKYALVIGNGNYTGITKLNNPVNDANDIAAALQSLGFTVEKLVDASREQMEGAVLKLKKRLEASNNAYGFFFYAGHGVQSGGLNYLIPVGADIPTENSLRDRAFSVQWALDELNEAGNSLNVIVLDACRDNPYSWKRSGSRGLTVVGSQPSESIIVYATGAGSTAADGTGKNGLFTGNLLNNLKKPGLEVTEVFRLTMGDVLRASNNQQRPAVYNQFSGTAYLGGKPAPGTQPVPIASNFVYVEGGTFTMGSPIGEEDREDNEVEHQVTVKSFYISKYEVTQKEYQEIMGTNPSYYKGNNLPVENVSWHDAIEYCNKRSIKEGLKPAYSGGGDNVKCDWNANGYRLPTEAEWEFAAKGGTKEYLTVAYSGSNSADAVGWYRKNSGKKIHAVGQKQANSLGLYDMSGNVWEWCWDWYGEYQRGAQTDPRGPVSGTNRVLRGGVWWSDVQYLRSAYRHSKDFEGKGGAPGYQNGSCGFRLVRSN